MCTPVAIRAVSIGVPKGQRYSRCTAIEPPESALHEVARFESDPLFLETLGAFASNILDSIFLGTVAVMIAD